MNVIWPYVAEWLREDFLSICEETARNAGLTLVEDARDFPVSLRVEPKDFL